MKIVPFDSSHVSAIVPQPQQATDLLCMQRSASDPVSDLAKLGPAVTGIDGDEVVFCVGKITQWEGRHIVWALISANAGRKMISMVRAFRRLLEMQKGEGRLEVIVRAGFPEGCRLIGRVMGFKYHHYEENFLPDGSDAHIYVRYV